MAKIINLSTYSDDRGHLTVIEKILPFEIKRVFYIYGVNNSSRGFHRHIKTIQAAVSVQGSCDIFIQDASGDKVYNLDEPSKCLIIEPDDYHWMDNFSKDCVLMVLASEYFDKNDYIYEKYIY